MIYEYKNESAAKKIKARVILIVIAIFAIISLIIGSNIYLKVAQLKEIGNPNGNLQSIYFTNLFYQFVFSGAAFVIIFIAIAITNIFIKRNMKNYFKENNLPAKKLPNYIIATVVGLFGALFSKDFFYQKALNFLNGGNFGSESPLFAGKDIGYFVFQRPFLMSLYQFLTTVWVLVIIYTVIYYVVNFMLIYSNELNLENFKVKTIVRHNLVNIAIFFIIKVVSYKFQQEGIVFSNFLNLKGAGYVDVNIWLNYFKIAPFLLVLIVITAFVFIWLGRLKRAAITIAVFPVIWIIVGIIASVTQNFVVKPNESNIEKPYLKNNMEQTRLAYGIDKIKSYEFPAIKDLTPEIVNRNLDTKDNIRIVDYNSTLKSDIQLQSNTNFYTFVSGDIINYKIKGKEIPVFITAREIDKSKLKVQNYINNTFKYTHGYGVVVNPINKLTPQGQVDFLLSGLRMDSVDKASLNITEPRIYYGELTNDQVIVNPASGKLKEIDYDGNTETSYSGKGGIKLNWFDRGLFALKYGDLNMIISGNVSSDSKLLLNRQIVNRAQMGVPFLTVDNDPYIILSSAGRLEWVLDAYTTTNDFPYSQNPENYTNFNYIRNSVKITVDAYDGSVKYYIIDKTDPLIKAYDKMYPGIFSQEELPADVKEHMRYPEELFKIQTNILKRYHLDPMDVKTGNENIGTFYFNQDMWNIAKSSVDIESSEVEDIDPYYTMIKLPGINSTNEELILMRPFTPSGDKHNMVSWLAMKNTSENYGEMVLYNFPKNTNILGPDQVDVNIKQIPDVSESMSLWGKSGSKVFKGNLLVIPIEDSVLYVEPIYIEANSTSSIPQVKKIVVGYQQGNDFKHGVGDTLDSALNNLFSGISVTPVKEGTPTETTGGTGKDTPGTTTDTDKQKTIKDITAKYNEIKKQLDDLGNMLNELNK